MEKPKATVIGISGLALTSEEKILIKNQSPFGFILFKRNISSPRQVKSLVNSIKDSVAWDIPIFIDQEGGRVQRLSGKDWILFPPVSIFGKIAKYSVKLAKEATFLNYQLISDDLITLGINVNCSPCIDLKIKGSDKIIGDRSFSINPEIVSLLGAISCKAMLSRGVFPVIKHIPGHGRAKVDSHKALPTIDTSWETLKKSDFIPFKNLNNKPFGMTAHIIYDCIDSKHPISLSSKALNFIREELSFKGILLSDDITMSALSGSLKDRAKRVITAGYDLVLYCDGNALANKDILDEVPSISSKMLNKWIKLSREIKQSIPTFDREKTYIRLKYLLESYYNFK